MLAVTDRLTRSGSRGSTRPTELDKRSQRNRFYRGKGNGKFRDERLSVNWFTTLRDAQQSIEAWRHDYNSVRPRKGLLSSPPIPLPTSPQYPTDSPPDSLRVGEDVAGARTFGLRPPPPFPPN